MDIDIERKICSLHSLLNNRTTDPVCSRCRTKDGVTFSELEEEINKNYRHNNQIKVKSFRLLTNNKFRNSFHHRVSDSFTDESNVDLPLHHCTSYEENQ